MTNKPECRAKHREFWIYSDMNDHITEMPCDVAKWKQKFIDDEILHHPEITHVIEYSAYQELKEKMEKAIELLKYSSKHLDGIKYECEASVYTLTDDEMGTVFFVRDNIDTALSELERKDEVEK